MATTVEDRQLAVVSLGTVVIDEIRGPSLPTQRDVPGGSATFAIMGARLVAGRERAGEIGCIIMAGGDFPETTLRQYESWGVTLAVKTDRTRPSTRGLLEYQDEVFGRKSFRYTTPLVRASPADLPASFLNAESFHLLAHPEELRSQVEQILTLRSTPDRRPLLVWEPAPPFCRRDTKDAHLEAAKLVDVFSPNHLELQAFFRDQPAAFDRRTVEDCAAAFLDSGVGPDGSGTLVVRAGEHGCLVASDPAEGRLLRWLPAPVTSSVVDATGAGNTHLGAFTFAMAGCSKDAVQAAAVANVAASFAIEQVGLPKLQRQESTGGEEQWNGGFFGERLEAYLSTMRVDDGAAP